MSHQPALRGVFAGVLLGVTVVNVVDAQTPYTTVTNTHRSVTNFNVETVRGLAWDDANSRLYAINTHGSRLVYFQSGAGADPIESWPTLNNPVSLVLFDDDLGQPRVLVVGGGTHGAAIHDRSTGEIVDFVKLESEPMDVVLDATGTKAFISCGGAFDRPIVRADGTNHFESGGAVVELRLGGSYDSVRTHFIPAPRPMFLSLDEGGPGVADDLILVASHLSGNQTTWRVDAAEANAEKAVVKTDPLLTQFPDEDIFSIDASGNVAPYLSGMGTLLTAHGRNPAPPNEYWVLNVEARNHEEVTEPAHRGKFADNRAMRVNTSSGTTVVESFDAVTDTASFPWDLGFHPTSGHAFVTSSTGDLVRVMTSTGALVRNVTLPDGAIPRSIHVDVNNVFVYAWGRNQVYRFDTNAMTAALPAPAPILETFELGFDPNPRAVRAGREIWYDAHRSSDPVDIVGSQRVSCNTCHPRGGMDLLAWQLSDKPVDDKDMMVTQSLFSIEDTFPYHWRGERSLSDFNGAFAGLLGGDELGVLELADFEAFVFSLQGAANPRQHIDRVIDDSLQLEFVSSPSVGGTGAVKVGRPWVGQTEFHTATNALNVFNPIRCVDCHGAESGTNGLITGDVLSFLPAQIQSDSAHLRQLGHKLFQPRYDVDAVGAGQLSDRPRGGFGLSQDGDNPDLLEFLNTPGTFFGASSSAPADVDLSVQQQVDTCSFVMQFDEGIAPRAHHAMWFDGSTDAQNDLDEMVLQAKSAWIDLVVFARTSTNVTFGMFFDRNGLVFRTAKSTTPGVLSLSPAALTGLYTPPSGPGLQLFFMGVPPGNGFRVAVDPDNDDVSAQLEIAYGMNPEKADSEPPGQEDGWPDGYELELYLATGLVSPLVFNTDGDIASADMAIPSIVGAERDHVTGRVSKHYVTFSEPVRYSTQPEIWDGTGYSAVGQPRRPIGAFRRFDTIVGHGYRPGEQYRLRVDMFDLSGKRNTQYLYDSDYVGGVPVTPIVNVSTRPQFFLSLPAPFLERFITSGMSVLGTGTTDEYQVTIDVETLVGTPVDETVVFQVLWKNGDDWEVVPLSDLTAVGATRIEPMMEFGGNFWGAGGVSGNAMGPVVSDPNTEGPFVFAESITSGSASATLQLTGYSGIECRVVVLGVFTEIDPPLIPGATNQFQGLDNMQWQMPMSPNSGRKFDFTPQ